MKKLYRSRHNRLVAGVCGGLEDSLGVDATIIRLLAVFATIATGIFPGIVTYVIGWVIIPEQPHGE